MQTVRRISSGEYSTCENISTPVVLILCLFLLLLLLLLL